MKFLPHYMSMGMSADEFWNGDPMLCQAYIEADRLNTERENTMLWLQGMYFSNALDVSLHNAFRGKGQSTVKYLEEPIRVTEMSREEKQRKELEEQKKIDNVLHRMKAQQERKKVTSNG